MNSHQTQTQKYQQIIAKCWADEAFKQKLLADPLGTLRQEGMEIPEGMTVRILENTQAEAHIVIPARPADLSDDQLTGTAGGGTCVPSSETEFSIAYTAAKPG